MKNRKGFTLIELLAIIVILAIIAVITVPIILNVIENASSGAAINSAHGFSDAVSKSYLTNLVTDSSNELPTGTYVMNDNGLLIDKDSNVLDVNVSGSVPEDGSWIKVVKGQVIAYSLKFGDYVVTKLEDTEAEAVKNGSIATDSSVTEIMDSIKTKYANEAAQEVANYITILLNDSTVQGYDNNTSKKVSEITSVNVPSGIDTESWVYFKKDTDVTASDYSIKITKGDYTFVVNCVDGVVSNPVESTTIEPQKVYIAPSFANDSWETIKNNLIADRNTYAIGSTKIIEMDRDNNGTNEYYKLRLVNTESCGDYTGSRTSCGVVIEFVTEIGTHVMNPTANGTTTLGDGNAGGWYSSQMRSWLNSDVLSLLPSDLKNVIIPTTPIISGSGSGGVSNNVVASGDFTGDKLYLISGKEIALNMEYDNKKEDTDTKTLKYYADNTGISYKIKYSATTSEGVDSGASWYWLRSANSYNTYTFFYINHLGGSVNDVATANGGVAPAFRILD